MPPAGFEPTIPAIKLSQTHALDRAATGIGHYIHMLQITAAAHTNCQSLHQRSAEPQGSEDPSLKNTTLCETVVVFHLSNTSVKR